MDSLDIFRKIPIFNELNNEEIDRIFTIAQKSSFKLGDIIFSEGDKGDGFYLIVRGEVKIAIKINTIGEEILSLLKGNVHFGEMTLIDDKPRSANAIAETDVICLYFDKDKFNKIIDDDISLGNKIRKGFLKTFSKRLRTTDNNVKRIISILKNNEERDNTEEEIKPTDEVPRKGELNMEKGNKTTEGEGEINHEFTNNGE
ncbi:cyclic nucleotide-binding domain-containing protein [candidate division WOR-3 bacterium]|nr:cyclic nucleotide-binding domain-containing protein [candidate division WOR-3 bacterium]